MKIGYDIHLSKSIQDAFSKAGVQCLFKHPVNKETDINNFNTFLLDNLRNEIILYDLNSIGSFTFIQLSKT